MGSILLFLGVLALLLLIYPFFVPWKKDTLSRSWVIFLCLLWAMNFTNDRLSHCHHSYTKIKNRTNRKRKDLQTMKTELEVNTLKSFQTELTRFFLAYKFALQEVETKINILQEEFKLIHEYNPIEHVSTRIKSPKSILTKMMKKELPPSIEAVRENIRDIAGARITCSFVEDIYKVSAMLQAQHDMEVVEMKDYIANPKENGYQSLHLIIKIPIFMSDHMEKVYTEIQIRTIAMDFWASLEHKIYYKYNKEVPEHIRHELKEAALQAAELDRKMERLNKEINILKENEAEPSLLDSTPIAHLAKYLTELPGNQIIDDTLFKK